MDFKIDTAIYDAVLTKFRAKIEGGSLASTMKRVLNEQPQGGILELEATESFWRALRLMQIARAVKSST